MTSKLRIRWTGAHTTGLDLHRVSRRAISAAMAGLAIVQLVLVGSGTQFGFDFRGGTWPAGYALLHGASPYPSPEPSVILHAASGFINPPVLALIAAPFALVPITLALALWTGLGMLALLIALRIAGIRDVNAVILVLCSFPVVSCIVLGQPDGLLALLVALTWRWRDAPRGALAAGTLIAAKLLAWPLLVWMILTRRTRLAALTLGVAVAELALGWATIGFTGLAGYPRLLWAEASAYGPHSHSLVTAFVHLGLAASPARIAATLLAGAFGLALAVRARGRGREDLLFLAAIATGLLLSPVLWQHYLAPLLVCVAISGRLRDPVTALLIAALWLSPSETPATGWQAWLVPLLVMAIGLRATMSPERQSVRAINSRLRILPVGLRGSSSTKMTSRGTL